MRLQYLDGTWEPVKLTYAEWLEVFQTGHYKDRPIAVAEVDAHTIRFEHPATPPLNPV